MKETEGEEGIVLVVKIKKEERRFRKIKRWIQGKKGVLPSGLCSCNLTNFMDKVAIFSIEVFGGKIMIPLFGL